MHSTTGIPLPSQAETPLGILGDLGDLAQRTDQVMVLGATCELDDFWCIEAVSSDF
jgi:hypothetical protein